MLFHDFSRPEIICLVLVLLTVLVNGEDIWCAQNIAEAESSFLCTCWQITRKEWSGNKDKTAPSPSNVSLNWYTFQYENLWYIGVQISWTQKESYIARSVGYYIEATSRTSQEASRYKCVVRNFTSTDPFVTFRFNDTREPPRRMVHQDTLWNYHVISLPLYRRNDTPSFRPYRLQIPPCDDSDDICRTVPCKDDRSKCRAKFNSDKKEEEAVVAEPQDDSIADTSTSLREENTVTQSAVPSNVYGTTDFKGITLQQGILMGVGFLFLTAVAAGIFFFSRKKGKVQQVPKRATKRRMLIIGDCGDELRLKITNDFVEILKKCGRERVQIATNARQVLEVADKGIVKWTMQEVEKADVIVFLISGNVSRPEAFDNDEIEHLLHDYSQVSAALMATEAAILKAKEWRREKKFLAVQMEERTTDTFRVPPFCQILLLRADLNVIVRQALGPHFRCGIFNKYREDFLNVQRSLLNNEHWDFSAQDRNNLDASMSPIQGEQIPLATFNILQGEYHSIESNVQN